LNCRSLVRWEVLGKKMHKQESKENIIPEKKRLQGGIKS